MVIYICAKFLSPRSNGSACRRWMDRHTDTQTWMLPKILPLTLTWEVQIAHTPICTPSISPLLLTIKPMKHPVELCLKWGDSFLRHYLIDRSAPFEVHEFVIDKGSSKCSNRCLTRGSLWRSYVDRRNCKQIKLSIKNDAAKNLLGL